MEFEQSDINRLTSNVAAIQSLFPSSLNPPDEPLETTWSDRMGLVHQLDDQWNYIQQPEMAVFPLLAPSYVGFVPIPPQNLRIDVIQPLIPSLWMPVNLVQMPAFFYNVPQNPDRYYRPIANFPVVWHNGIQYLPNQYWPIGNDSHEEFEREDNEEDADSGSDWDSEWDEEFEDDWESDSGFGTQQSESSDDTSDDDSLSDSSTNSSIRQPNPNEYLRRLQEFEEFEINMHTDCPYCRLQRQYMCNFYRLNARHRPENHRWRPW